MMLDQLMSAGKKGPVQRDWFAATYQIISGDRHIDVIWWIYVHKINVYHFNLTLNATKCLLKFRLGVYLELSFLTG